MIIKLLIATKNQGKIEEYKALLETVGIKVITLADISIKGEPFENGQTFKENALIKARFYAKAAGMVTLADDGGIMIDALNGEPGVKSRRWLGYEASDEELVAYTLKRLQGVPLEKRTARIGSALAVVAPDGQEQTFEAAVEGTIAEQAARPIPNGLPFRAVFVVQSISKVWAQLTPQGSQRIGHRTKLIAQALPFIKSLIR